MCTIIRKLVTSSLFNIYRNNKKQLYAFSLYQEQTSGRSIQPNSLIVTSCIATFLLNNLSNAYHHKPVIH